MKYQIAIIGGGPAGYTAAEAAGKARLSVVLFEKRSLGGVCLNEGCIPTKTLLYSAKVYDYAKHASKYAVNVPEASFDLGKIVARKSKVVRKLVLGIKAKLTAHQVNIVTGEATIVDKNTIQCGGETYECENLLLCTGRICQKRNQVPAQYESSRGIQRGDRYYCVIRKCRWSRNCYS